MNKTILTIITAAILMCANVAHADHWSGGHKYGSSSNSKGSSGIGVVAGSTYGVGIGFRYTFKDSPVGIQFGGFPLIKKKEGLFSAAAGLQFTLHTGNYGRAFVSLSSSVLHAYNGGMDTIPEGESYTLWAVGPGVGIEFRFLDNFSFAIDVPAASFFDSEEGFVGMLPIPNLSFMFTW